MKRYVAALLALLLCLSAAACGEDKPNVEAAKTLPEGLSAFSGGGEGAEFSTLYRADGNAVWDDTNGLVLYTVPGSAIPNVRVIRIPGTGFDVAAYFSDYFTPGMRSEMRERFISAGELQEYAVGGRTLTGATYSYSALEGEVLELTRVFEQLEDSVVMYTVETARGGDDAAFEALDDLARYFQPQADYYADYAEYSAAAAPKTDASKKSGGAKLSIVPEETASISYTTYDNGLISMKIPAGWRVDICPAGYTFYAFRAYDPARPDYQIVAALKFEGAVKSQAARDWYTTNYGADNIFAKTAILIDNSTAGFFGAFNDVCALNNTDAMQYPYMYDFTVIEDLGATVFGGRLLRAVYDSERGARVQGLFTATVVEMNTYNTNSLVYDLRSPLVDVGLRNVYSVFFYTAPEDAFIQWQSVLDSCLYTLNYSDAFMDGYAQEQGQIMETFNSVRQTGSEISSMIMSSWEARSNSYDIISQKQSDATLGYARVYDTENGDIYKAYNGFTDDYDGERYKPVTDDMYTQPVKGYIEK